MVKCTIRPVFSNYIRGPSPGHLRFFSGAAPGQVRVWCGNATEKLRNLSGNPPETFGNFRGFPENPRFWPGFDPALPRTCPGDVSGKGGRSLPDQALEVLKTSRVFGYPHPFPSAYICGYDLFVSSSLSLSLSTRGQCSTFKFRQNSIIDPTVWAAKFCGS